MEVILKEKLNNFPKNKIGKKIKVKSGYARNFLLPKGKVLPLTKENLQFFEKKQYDLQKEAIKKLENIKKIAKKMQNLNLIIYKKSSKNGKLFGSITSREISKQLELIGFHISKKLIRIKQNKSIKMLGTFKVLIKLHPEISLNILVTVKNN